MNSKLRQTEEGEKYRKRIKGRKDEPRFIKSPLQSKQKIQKQEPEPGKGQEGTTIYE
jgi:hypothetical protein